MASPSINEPVAIPQTEEEQIAELRRLVQEGSAKLVAPDGRQIELPDTIHELLLTIACSKACGLQLEVLSARASISRLDK